MKYKVWDHNDDSTMITIEATSAAEAGEIFAFETHAAGEVELAAVDEDNVRWDISVEASVEYEGFAHRVEEKE